MSRLRIRRLWSGLSAISFLAFLVSTQARAQDPLENAPLAPQSAPTADADDKTQSDASSKADPQAKAKSQPEFVVKSAAEWHRILTRQQFAVTRQKATEPPFSGIYATGHFKGNFVCVDCDRAGFETVVFSAQHKFESGTGWPSFYRAASDRAIRTAPDYGGIEEPRVEVMCRRCGAHLGHVFDDGPPPTGLRFCINSIAIKLKSPNGESRPRSAATKTTSKSTSKTKATASATSASKKTQPGGASRPAGSGRPPSGNQAQGDS
jgi:peptide-methionine (R)-S-oxide reductase